MRPEVAGTTAAPDAESAATTPRRTDHRADIAPHLAPTASYSQAARPCHPRIRWPPRICNTTDQGEAPLKLHHHVTPVLEPHRVREADQALAQRHADRAGAVAAAEEAHAVHEGAVGHARRDEEDVRPGGEVLLGVDTLQVRDAHLPHALLLPGLGGHEAREHAAVEAAERGGGEHALGGAADPHHGVHVGAPHGGRDAGREVAIADQFDARAGLADVGDQLLVARAVEDDAAL